MAVIQSPGDIYPEIPHRIWRKATVLTQNGPQITTRAVLQNNPEMPRGLIPGVEFEDIWVRQRIEDA